MLWRLFIAALWSPAGKGLISWLLFVMFNCVFSTLYTTLPHNLIKDKLIDLIERTFQREGSPYLACNDRNAFFTSEKPKKYHAWSCQNVCDALTFFWTTFLFDLAPSSIDK